VDEVADGLFVGTFEDAATLTLLHRSSITAVVSLTHDDLPWQPAPTVSVLSVPFRDGPDHDAEAFARAVDGTLELLRDGERVLVHCSAGASRSGAVAAAVVALREGVAVDEAFEQVAAGRDAVDPHPALRRRAASVVAARRA
jgi:predicted protein tyrosine phosphatase